MISVKDQETEQNNENQRSPKKAFLAKKKEEIKEKDDKDNVKRQRLDLLTQIKYTLIYDDKVDREPVDKFLKEYEKQQRLLGIADF